MHRVELKTIFAYSFAHSSPAVPNAPCGVENFYNHFYRPFYDMFLMHRVELKIRSVSDSENAVLSVPNAPCGVENFTSKAFGAVPAMVPNAPCGVEKLLGGYLPVAFGRS